MMGTVEHLMAGVVVMVVCMVTRGGGPMAMLRGARSLRTSTLPGVKALASSSSRLYLMLAVPLPEPLPLLGCEGCPLCRCWGVRAALCAAAGV